jgi:Domain of unknown function (DUF4395)
MPWKETNMPESAVMNFMKQQGFALEPRDRAALRFKGLQFQPTIVGATMLVAILTKSPTIFLIVSAVLWLNVLVPAANPFENFYNRFVARPRGRPPLTKAPGPRRFAQGMAATFMLAAGLAMLQGWQAAAYLFQGLIAVAFAALLFGKFCLGAYVYHLLKGDVAFANGTCPWSDSA